MNLAYVNLTLLTVLVASCVNSQVSTTEVSACNFAKNYHPEITIDKSIWMDVKKRSSDSCILTLIDTLVSKSIRHPGDGPLKSLAKIYLHSDGYISEYIIEVGASLFHHDFNDLFTLMARDSSMTLPLQEIVVRSLSMDAADSEDPKNRKLELDSFSKSQIQRHNLPPKTSKMVSGTIEKVDEKMYD